MKINNLTGFRYSITGLLNDTHGPFTPVSQASLTVTMSATYAQLIELHITRLQRESTSAHPEQISRNHMTALRGFLQSIDKTESSPIGLEMTTEHATSVKQYLASISVSDRSKSDRRSQLNAWRDTFALLGASPIAPVRGRERRFAAIAPPAPTAFESGLRAGLKAAGLTPKGAAVKAGISTSALGRWSRGALPNLRSIESLYKLEQTLNLPGGHLASLFKQSLGACESVHKNEFRERSKSRTTSKYLLKARSLCEPFLSNWSDFLRYKCALRMDGKRRRSNARWSATSNDKTAHAIQGITTFNGNHYASAGILWNHISAYLGFLQMPEIEGGWGVSALEVQCKRTVIPPLRAAA